MWEPWFRSKPETFTVAVLIDSCDFEKRRVAAENKIKTTLQFISQKFWDAFKIRFVITSIKPWQPPTQYCPRYSQVVRDAAALNDLYKLFDSCGADLLVAFTNLVLVGRSTTLQEHTVQIGGATKMYGECAIVGFFDEPLSAQRIAFHEFGHMFGAPHNFGRSVMNPRHCYENFERRDKKIIAHNKRMGFLHRN